jgi:hypothetical protein
MADTIKPRRSGTASSVPTTAQLADGELAVNTADKIIYMRAGASIVALSSGFDGAFSSLSGIPTTVGGYGITDAVDTSSAQSIGGAKTMTASTFRVGQGSGIEAIYVNGGAGSVSAYFMQSGGSDRWVFGKNSDTESGSNAGSSFLLQAYDDSGASLGAVLTVARATRIADFAVTPTVAGTTVAKTSDLPTFDSGTYTPTATAVANVDSASPGAFHYIRIGNEVSFSGYLVIDPTASNTVTQVSLTLPIASTLGNSLSDAAGVASASGATGVYGFVRSNGAGQLLVEVRTNTATSQTWRVSGHYTVN